MSGETRGILIWVFGILASGFAGGLIGTLIGALVRYLADGHAVDADGAGYVAFIAGASAFACLRLWLTHPKD